MIRPVEKLPTRPELQALIEAYNAADAAYAAKLEEHAERSIANDHLNHPLAGYRWTVEEGLRYLVVETGNALLNSVTVDDLPSLRQSVLKPHLRRLLEPRVTARDQANDEAAAPPSPPVKLTFWQRLGKMLGGSQ